MRLHDAEVTAEIALPRHAGNLSLRALAPHTEAAALVLEVNASSPALLRQLVDPRTAADCALTQFRFVPARSASMRHGPPSDYQPNPPPLCSAKACAGACGGGAARGFPPSSPPRGINPSIQRPRFPLCSVLSSSPPRSGKHSPGSIQQE